MIAMAFVLHMLYVNATLYKFTYYLHRSAQQHLFTFYTHTPVYTHTIHVYVHIFGLHTSTLYKTIV